MQWRLAIQIFGLTLLWSAAASATVAIPVANPSFETQILAEGTFTNDNVTSWSNVGNGCPFCFGAFNPALNDVGFPSGIVPDGNNAVYMCCNMLQQTLTGVTLTANTRYTLTVAIGNPNDRPDNINNIGFDLGIVGSNQLVAGFSTSLGTIPNGGFVDRTGTADIAVGNPDIGKTLIVRLLNSNQSFPGGPYVAFDHVRLTSEALVPALVPLPAAGWMLLSGLAGLVIRLRERGQLV